MIKKGKKKETKQGKRSTQRQNESKERGTEFIKEEREGEPQKQ